MPRILIAYDGSDSARSAVRTAGRLFPGGDAVLLHAFDAPPGPERALFAGAVPNEAFKEAFEALEREVTDEATAIAEEGRGLAAEAGLAAETSTVATSQGAWPEILAAAAEHGADLIVSGTRGQGRLGRALLGSTSSSLLHQADLPLLIVPAGEHETGGPLVIGYDGSDDARAAIATLGALFPGRAAVIAHAWDWPLTDTLSERALMAMPMVRASEVVDILKETAEEAARDVAEAGRALAEQHGLRARVELLQTTEGEWRALLAAAADLGAAVLAAGSRGRGAVTSSLLGSVSTTLAHHAERPTLIVRPAG